MNIKINETTMPLCPNCNSQNIMKSFTGRWMCLDCNTIFEEPEKDDSENNESDPDENEI